MTNCKQDDRKGPSLMKSVPGKSSVKKTMRVATAFTGVAAGVGGVAAFAPAAQANSQVAYPYVLWVKTSPLISYIRVCGWKDVGGGEWYCTGIESNPYEFTTHSNYFGGNWKDGKVDVSVWNGTGSPFVHRCNTNGAYHGVFRGTGTGFGVSLSAGYHNPLGAGNSEC
jgi:hypothetical protein